MLGIASSIGFLNDPADILIFLGRLHPLVVHLPIGFLLLGALAQLAARKSKFQAITPLISYVWALGAISAFFAIVFGYLLSLSGDYDSDTLFWHKWMGVGVLLFSIGCYYATKKITTSFVYTKWFFVGLTVVSVFITGHLGGNLTHGSTYLLEFAPNAIRGLAGMPPKVEPRKKITELDSADVFLDLISPMLDSKCTSCHNDGKKKGKLELTTYNEIMSGGEGGDVVIPGDALNSELFKRITLPEDHDDFMPSEGKRPLTDNEVSLIEWWINVGAPPDGYFTQFDPEQEFVAMAENFFGLDRENQLYGRAVEAPDKALVDSLESRGFVLNRLMKDNYFMDANFSLSERSLESSDVELLVQLKEQLIWLDISNSNVHDTHLGTLGQLENLVRLDVSGNAITNVGVNHLVELKNLESLNLFDTRVSDGVLPVISNMKALQKVYLWQTDISPEGISKLRRENSGLKIISERE
ncbi:c-type cytochrome domain-containing protein [uncultured Kriegella sp.]|uniref:c-type cytochrome domain-containing protein n=1 Tax=uncultured Kriegella sp. TaxID=1798910 RepID=UPI0030DCBAE3|tara:strand:- start:150952 stop:152358 length:1407 start_codon:yes stop_codon:yes gene_type:complete